MENDIRAIIQQEIELYESKLIDKIMAIVIKYINSKETTYGNNASHNDQLVPYAMQQQLAIVAEELQANIYSQVITAINENIVPVINKQQAYINYKLSDDDVTIDAFRRCVEYQVNQITADMVDPDTLLVADPNALRLTAGENGAPGQIVAINGGPIQFTKKDARIIAPHIRTFFRDDSTDSDDDRYEVEKKWADDDKI
jgi:septum formation topological specificity factor MinE